MDQADRSIYRSWGECRSRYCDLDPNGHVNNGAINAFFEEARVRFRRDSLGANFGDLLKGFVVARYAVEYLHPLGYPSIVDIGTAVTEIGHTSYQLAQGMFEDARCIATAQVIAVRVDPVSGGPIPLSPELQQALNAFGVAEGAD